MTILTVPPLILTGLNMVIFNRRIAQWMIDLNPFSNDDWLGFTRFMAVLVGLAWAGVGAAMLMARPAGSPWPWVVVILVLLLAGEGAILAHRRLRRAASHRSTIGGAADRSRPKLR